MSSFSNLFQVLVAGFLLTAVGANPPHVRLGLHRAVCPEDYSPCVCDLTANGLEIACQDVTVAEILDVFYRTRSLDIYSVSLTATSATGSIDLPADLLKDKRVEHIYLNCPAAASPKLGLTIDPSSFQYTRFNTTIFEIHDCDLVAQTSLSFLTGFTVLDSLRIVDTLNVESIATLPANTLTLLKELSIVSCTGLETAAFPDLTPARLERLYLSGNALTDTAVNGILVSVGSSSSANTLVDFSLASNALTKVPRIAAFSKLVSYDVSNNAIPFISQSALLFGSRVSSLNLNNIALTAIEGGAFSGDFTFAQVGVEGNKLTEFRADVFKSMLQQMAAQPAGTGGQVVVTGNPFDCGCPLAWLIRDNQALIPNVKNGVCGGFFRFEDLNPDAYINCP